MSNQTNLTAFVAGMILVGLGGLFLIANLTGWTVDWWWLAKISLPVLFIYVGIWKLARHFFWPTEKVLQYPGKASLLGGIFWTGLGLVLLLHLLGALDTLRFIGRYWPIALILFGLGKIFDYYRFRGKVQIHAGEIFGLVFIVFFGIAANRLSQAHFPLIDSEWAGIRWGSIFRTEPRFEFTQEIRIPNEAFNSVEIRNLYGDVRIEAFPGDDEIELQLQKVIRGESEEDAGKVASAVEIRRGLQDGVLLLGTNREDLGEAGTRLNTHLAVRVPESIPVRVWNGYGNVTVTRLKADLRAENSYGNITARQIDGQVHVVGRYRPVQVEEIRGNVSIENRRGSIQIREVTGNVTAKTDYETVTAREVRGNLAVQNHFGKVTAVKVQGSVAIEAPGSEVELTEIDMEARVVHSHKRLQARNLRAGLILETSYSRADLREIGGDVVIQASHSQVQGRSLGGRLEVKGRGTSVDAVQIAGPILVQTTLRRVKLENLSAEIRVENEFGDVEIDQRRSLPAAVTVINKNAGISLTVPEDAGFVLAAEASGGDIRSDLGGPEPYSTLNTTVGEGGPRIQVETTFGRITIRRRG